MAEKFCAEISTFGGLWFTEEQIEPKLVEMETDSEKHATLKCQLQFRQKVFSMCPNNEKNFFFYLKRVR